MRRKKARGIPANAERALNSLLDHYGEEFGYALYVELWMRAEQLRRMDGPAAPHYASVLEKLHKDLERVMVARGVIG